MLLLGPGSGEVGVGSTLGSTRWQRSFAPAPTAQSSHMPDMHKYTQHAHLRIHTHTKGCWGVEGWGGVALHVHRLTPLPLLSFLVLLLLILLLPLFSLLLWAQARCPREVRRQLAHLRGLRVSEGAAIVVEEPAKGELVEGVLRVLPVGGAEQVQGPRAVLAVAPGAGPALLLHGVKVGRVHRVSNLGLVGGRLLPQIAGEVQLGEEGVSFDLAGAVGAQAVLGGAAEATDDVDGLWAEFDLGRHLQGALPVNDLQREEVSA